MQEKFSKYRPTAFKEIAVNAAMILSDFTPSTGTFDPDDIIAVTDGGINFTAKPTYKDWGEDMDNVPKNTKELKRLDDWEVKFTGTFTTITPELAKMLAAAADESSGHITPRGMLNTSADFHDFWIVGDYSDKNSGSGAGYIAIKIINALSTGGFALQTKDKDKGKFSFEFTGHYSADAQDTVPFDIYIKAGSTAPGISLDKSRATVAVGSTVTLTATRYPAASTVTWASNDTDVATVSGGVVTGNAAGYAVITASITESTVTYTDFCTVQVVPAS